MGAQDEPELLARTETKLAMTLGGGRAQLGLKNLVLMLKELETIRIKIQVQPQEMHR